MHIEVAKGDTIIINSYGILDFEAAKIVEPDLIFLN